MVDFIDRSLEEPNEELKLYEDRTSVPKYLKGEAKTLLRFDHRPNITQADVDKGSIKRYFAKQSNHTNGDIVEISEKHYNDLVNAPLYQTAVITWRIKGRLEDIPNMNSEGPKNLYMGVLSSNKLAIQDGERQLPGLDRKLSDPLEFYQRA